ncbi:MAG: tetratricopeptide repeat protein [Alphaproteobacteria bacterium]|nr:tetratricopeptide repeat protein [Alphaproteobacteria bacterium]MBV9376199.1 tetratricopeptide repeat protein [Alphaproteobacteria bacterium]
MRYLRRAAALRPASVEILNNLGTALHDQGECDMAISWYRRALALKDRRSRDARQSCQCALRPR